MSYTTHFNPIPPTPLNSPTKYIQHFYKNLEDELAKDIPNSDTWLASEIDDDPKEEGQGPSKPITIPERKEWPNIHFGD